MPRPFHRQRTFKIGNSRFQSEGLSQRFWGDIYYYALTVRWPVFFGSAAVLFLVLNGLFAILYLLGPNSIGNISPPGFGGAFFFSVETLATVGYGGMYPATVYGHLLATLEIFTGMSSIALLTGLTFARFSRPRARIMFAKYPVIHSINGSPTLVIRAANARQDIIAGASARLHLVRNNKSPEGVEMYRIIDLKLVRDRHPMFTLTWNLMHIVDQTSPLYGATAETMAASDSTLLLTIEGIDETTSQPVFARQHWSCSSIRWDHRYRSIFRNDGRGKHIIDYRVFHDVEPVEGMSTSPDHANVQK